MALAIGDCPVQQCAHWSNLPKGIGLGEVGPVPCFHQNWYRTIYLQQTGAFNVDDVAGLVGPPMVLSDATKGPRTWTPLQSTTQATIGPILYLTSYLVSGWVRISQLLQKQDFWSGTTLSVDLHADITLLLIIGLNHFQTSLDFSLRHQVSPHDPQR